MKIQGDISILISADQTTIEIRDRAASTTFVKLNLSPEELCKALSRQNHVQCDLHVMGLENVGKKHENKDYEFKLYDNFERVYGEKERREQDLFLSQIAQTELDLLNEGWIAGSYFSSQNSFFQKNGEKWARVTIRRWI